MTDIIYTIIIFLVLNIPVAHLLAATSSQTWKREYTGLCITESVVSVLFFSAIWFLTFTISIPAAITGLIVGAFFYIMCM